MGLITNLRRVSILVILTAASSGVASAADYEIAIAKMKFGPTPAELKVGDVIVWRNDDIFRHTATARDKSFDVDLPPKAEVRMTISKAGMVDYYCRFHPAMVGKLDVRQ
ncbi:cupredoxin family copper-binding protein [Rhizobium sp. TH2]|uniref:cupredoxin domain-containing protein n=1 Tax=Rhizobium sp. TH2 TaxID=2775403 RepID=UPI002157DD80|nr:cupredoxin family copper-binding protein [Rhizobium sp. TH2]UVC11800.1 cupredoxin family copper-binding protein [Rhizobium sp. TH2]